MASPRMRARYGLLLGAVLVGLLGASCARQSAELAALRAEPMANQAAPAGTSLESTTVVDSGSTMGKPRHATVQVVYRGRDAALVRAAAAALIAAAEADGWRFSVVDGPAALARKVVGGRASSLSIAPLTDDAAPEVVVTLADLPGV